MTQKINDKFTNFFFISLVLHIVLIYYITSNKIRPYTPVRPSTITLEFLPNMKVANKTVITANQKIDNILSKASKSEKVTKTNKSQNSATAPKEKLTSPTIKNSPNLDSKVLKKISKPEPKIEKKIPEVSTKPKKDIEAKKKAPANTSPKQNTVNKKIDLKKADSNTQAHDSVFDALSNIESGDPFSNLSDTISHIDAVKAQIQSHWNHTIGVARGISVKLVITLNQDGSIDSLKEISRNCPSDAKICNAFVQNTKRSIWAANPLQGLDVAEYASWKSITLEFIPEY